MTVTQEKGQVVITGKRGRVLVMPPDGATVTVLPARRLGCRNDEIYAATAHLLTTCKGDGGLVLGASNAVQPDVPMANYRAMVRAWQDCGVYTETTHR